MTPVQNTLNNTPILCSLKPPDEVKSTMWHHSQSKAKEAQHDAQTIKENKKNQTIQMNLVIDKNGKIAPA